MGVVVGIVFLTSVKLKIYCMLYGFHKLYLLLPVLGHHFGYLVVLWWMLDSLCFNHLVALSYIGKVTKVFLLTSSGSEMADHVGLGSGVFSTPPPNGMSMYKLIFGSWI